MVAVEMIPWSALARRHSITVMGSGTTFTVADTIPTRNSTDMLINIEHVQFSDQTISLNALPTSVQQKIFGLYAALYNRAAEYPGYAYWVGVIGQQSDATGVTVANAGSAAITLNDANILGQAFVNTQATYFNQIYGSLTDSAFIGTLYTNIGGNTGDPGGVAYWANLLQQVEGANSTTA